LGLAQGATGEILLHHILVQARHDNSHKDTTQKLLPKILTIGYIIKDKNATSLI